MENDKQIKYREEWEWANENWRKSLLTEIENYIKNELWEELSNNSKYDIICKNIKDKTVILINNYKYRNHFLIKENWKIRKVELNPDILNDNNRSLANIDEEWDHFIINLKTREKSLHYRIDKDGKCTLIKEEKNN